ncbi:serine/threonine-protein kinase PrkC [Clostridium homopropionicum DSM 5847]|uniref:non-specific serine/threonine protein kinase n=1 Tax=Clostridium homopropionicum DSM 5847 TaxID=1121318 RepID=A0A0L6ZCI8_9CLOT|nr:Stk1 family PASTA domain-containing Ser/Thr kinase [Clostridium homopropionicum]KOA20528.1 serine/threonine-protein kinase PrkC [Clostridium homopropionicum DSM 5847]SFG37762.1 serine/threonine protein kinase [Clostridium homopropionicum]
MIGTILGNRYELLEKIGEGGMAEVYKAKCHLLNRYVAVKILKSQFVDNMEFVAKFKQEAASAASLSHNNIVSIYDIGSEKNINYIVMEYIDGKTLKEIINEQKVLRYNEAIILAIQIGKALECAHKNNIIHRDVKPHNILVTKDGVVKVTDFGIAKATSSVTITNSDRILGSAHYFSPEQARGNYVDCKTDIYSLGIILYEMVTGKLPYDGDSPVSVAIKHIQEQVKPPKEVNPKIPESLNRLILKAIEKEQFRRYQSATEILNDLQKIKDNPNVELSIDNKENDYTMIMRPIHDYEDEDYDDIENDEIENVSGGSGITMKKKKILIVSLIAITVILVGFISAYMLSGGKLSGVDKPTGKVIVPDIIGLDKEEAQRLVEEKDLKFVATTESSDKPAGVVINCYPYPGTEIDRSENDEVRVILSSGPKVSTVPNLIEIEFEAAKEYLKVYNLKLGKVTYVFSDTIDKGKVADQSPKPDSPIGTNTTVDLVVSNGSESKMTKVPNLVNKNVDEAEELIVNAKLKLGVLTKIKTQDESKDGIVTVQSIEPNKEVKENTVINLSYYVYGDKSLIIVPNFVNKTVKEARRIAQNYDLILDVSGRDDFIITVQDTYAGKEVEAGTVIKLTSEPNP